MRKETGIQFVLTAAIFAGIFAATASQATSPRPPRPEMPYGNYNLFENEETASAQCGSGVEMTLDNAMYSGNVVFLKDRMISASPGCNVIAIYLDPRDRAYQVTNVTHDRCGGTTIFAKRENEGTATLKIHHRSEKFGASENLRCFRSGKSPTFTMEETAADGTVSTYMSSTNFAPFHGISPDPMIAE